MKSVLFIQYSSLSHINAALRIAEVLRCDGYEIHYFIHAKAFKYVNADKYKVYGSATLPMREKYNKALLKEMKLYQNYFQELKNPGSALQIDGRENELLQAIDQIMPSIIIADTFAALDFILLYNTLKSKQIKFFYLEILLTAIERKGIPYLTSKAMPHQQVKILIEHLRRECARRVRRTLKRLLYLGFDNYSMIKKAINENGVPDIYAINENNYLDSVCDNIHTLVVVPDELEFYPPDKNQYRHNLGFLKNEHDQRAEIKDSRLLEIIGLRKKIIYISFGTIFVHRRMEDIIAYLHKLNSVLADWPFVTAIFSAGGANLPKSESQKLVNIHFFNFVPQSTLLEYCEVFVTHGGINSIRESLYQSVPMLVYPLAMDQIGNARKIKYKGLGLMGDIKKDSPLDLKAKLSALLNNNNYKMNVKKFTRTLLQLDVDEKLRSIIEKYGSIE
jgi:zeaxanthin glucosyltransferase